jgi:hypothetical protein
VVEHQIGHQLEGAAYLLDLLPRPELRIDLVVVDDGKPVIRGVGKKGKYVDARDGAPQLLVREVAQTRERACHLALEGIAVGDQEGILLCQREVTRAAVRRRLYMSAFPLHYLGHTARRLLALLLSVYAPQELTNFPVHTFSSNQFF